MVLQITLPDSDPLQDSLSYLSTQHLIPLVKASILQSFFSSPLPVLSQTKQQDAYFEHFEREVPLALCDHRGEDLSGLRFCHVVAIKEMMFEDQERMEMERYLRAQGVGELVGVGEVVDLVARLWLMVENGRPRLRHRETTLGWEEGSLAEALQDHFHQKPSLKEFSLGNPKKVSLDDSFTAKNINEKGITIIWTSNLLEHLRLDGDTVAIFHHASFLNYQKNCAIYPHGLIEETLRTLSLLLPSSVEETKQWFIPYQVQLYLDGEAIQCRALIEEERNLEDFVFWRERLTLLKKAYDRKRRGYFVGIIWRCLSFFR